MKRLLMLLITSILISAEVWAYCYQLDPYSYNNCIQQENYAQQLQQNHQQQLFMQRMQMYQQQRIQQQQLNMQKQLLQNQMYQQNFIPPYEYHYNNNDYFAGNPKVDYNRYMLEVAHGHAPYMSYEEFLETYKYRY